MSEKIQHSRASNEKKTQEIGFRSRDNKFNKLSFEAEMPVMRVAQRIGNRAAIQMMSGIQEAAVQKKNLEPGAGVIQCFADEAAARAWIDARWTLADYVVIDYNPGDGNCHSYTYSDDLSTPLTISSVDTVLDYYDRVSKVTVFMNEGEVAHSAKGHDAECYHKLGDLGPLIKCSAANTMAAFGYEEVFKLPDEIEAFRTYEATEVFEDENEELNISIFSQYLGNLEMQGRESDVKKFLFKYDSPSNEATAEIRRIKGE